MKLLFERVVTFISMAERIFKTLNSVAFNICNARVSVSLVELKG